MYTTSRLSSLFALLTLFTVHTYASITVAYAPGTGPQATLAKQAIGGVANTTTLAAPPAPTQAPNLAYTLNVELTNPQNVSIPIPAGFMGFSIEMSVANQILGKNSTLIQVPFLNLMANLIKRSGIVKIRVGGNTQDTAALVDSLDNGRVLEKQIAQNSKTPVLTYTRDLLKMMRAISDFVNIHWYVGAAYINANPWNMDMLVISQQILGDYLLGIQAGNEPDQYNFNGRTFRGQEYNQQAYFTEWGQFIAQMNGNDSIANKNMLLGPGISNQWSPDSVWGTGYLDSYANNMAAIVVERYPDDNCAFLFPNPNNPPRNPQDQLPKYLIHQTAVDLVGNYHSSTALAQQKNKPIIMFETNTASCGGFPGIADAFSGALWSVDYALQMASWGFSGALFHIGGQTAFYNPFTPPPTNQSSFHQWTVGSIYYSTIVVAEAIGSSGKAQLRDLGPNNGDQKTPAYGVWEDGNLVKLVFINFNDNGSGGNFDSKVTFNGPAGASSLKIKQLKADSVNQKHNITWNGQTWGDIFGSDGRPNGTELQETTPCDGNGQCTLTVVAPSVVIVFFTDAAYDNVEKATFTQGGQGAQGGAMTFSTTVRTKIHNTATVDPQVLATSNGMRGLDDGQGVGSTSQGKSSATGRVTLSIGVGVLTMIAFGLLVGGGRGLGR